MTNEEKLTKYIEDKVKPITINERAKSKLAALLIEYPLDFLKECVEISFSKYIIYDWDGKIQESSFNDFFNKIGGIAHNRSLNPVDKEITHILNIGSSAFTYWNNNTANTILRKYVAELRKNDWSDELILNDLKTEVMPLFQSQNNWSNWRTVMEGWISDIIKWQEMDTSNTIISNSSIIPNELIDGLQRNIKQLCYQINSSYEHNLFDCCAVIMRRLLEILLIETYATNGLDDEIKLENGYYLTLDKLIDKIDISKKIRFSATTKKDLKQIKEIGNLSAHKIWYNCTKTDIDAIKQKYRLIIEELLYLSGFISNK